MTTKTKYKKYVKKMEHTNRWMFSVNQTLYYQIDTFDEWKDKQTTGVKDTKGKNNE